MVESSIIGDIDTNKERLTRGCRSVIQKVRYSTHGGDTEESGVGRAIPGGDHLGLAERREHVNLSPRSSRTSVCDTSHLLPTLSLRSVLAWSVTRQHAL